MKGHLHIQRDLTNYLAYEGPRFIFSWLEDWMDTSAGLEAIEERNLSFMPAIEPQSPNH
jgi:hypothetical protein